MRASSTTPEERRRWREDGFFVRRGVFGAAELGQGGGAAAAAFLFHAGFGLSHLLHAQVQVAIPLKGVHRQVQVGVDQ